MRSLLGATSIETWEDIVSNTPRELGKLFSKIVDSIPKHHRCGVFFVFPIAMRMTLGV
jgi:hypothetical protein